MLKDTAFKNEKKKALKKKVCEEIIHSHRLLFRRFCPLGRPKVTYPHCSHVMAVVMVMIITRGMMVHVFEWFEMVRLIVLLFMVVVMVIAMKIIVDGEDVAMCRVEIDVEVTSREVEISSVWVRVYFHLSHVM